MNGKHKSKSILIIGMGRFGRHLARKMNELGNSVMVVDKEEGIVQTLSATIEDVVVGDCTDENILAALGVNNFDICFVTIGANFESSLIVTSLLKKLGAKKVVTKAARDIQTDILRKIGADEVVYPERELAEKLAIKHNDNSVFDFIELSDGLAIFEMHAPQFWIGKSISELNVRRKYKVNILAIKRANDFVAIPDADYEFHGGDLIIVLGNKAELERFPR